MFRSVQPLIPLQCRNYKANLQLPVHSIHQNPKPENGAMFACQMLMVLAAKQAKPTYQLPKIDAKNVESLSAAIIFCKSNQNAKIYARCPILQNCNFLMFLKLLRYAIFCSCCLFCYS